ncbi:MAG: carbohydrate ABC transporter permease, partial [Oscillospiraceae bacterium]
MKKHLKWNTRCVLCLFPSLIGTAVFFVIPYIRVLYYSVIDNQFKRNFVGFSNYIRTLRNEYFLLALKNSLLLIVICVPVLILLALVISLALSYGIKWVRRTRAAFVLPMVIPTASIVLIWRGVFSGNTTVLPIYLLFIWKNIGICVVLLT